MSKFKHGDTVRVLNCSYLNTPKVSNVITLNKENCIIRVHDCVLLATNSFKQGATVIEHETHLTYHDSQLELVRRKPETLWQHIKDWLLY